MSCAQFMVFHKVVRLRFSGHRTAERADRAAGPGGAAERHAPGFVFLRMEPFSEREGGFCSAASESF